MFIWKVTFFETVEYRKSPDEVTMNFAAETFESLCLMLGDRVVTEIERCEEITIPDPEDRASLLPDDRMDAWGIIANAYGGNWDNSSPVWRKAAERWRDLYMGGRPATPTIDHPPTSQRPPDLVAEFDNDL